MAKESNQKSARADVKVTESEKRDRPLRRTFPGPGGADARLRVAVDRGAQSDLMAHARESLELEVCGVLVGAVCVDDEGEWVHVEAIIRGTAASQASTHVTFTQETWNKIHADLEKHYSKLRIVGWYHTHPGFGVEFSDMDLFIQKNFFGAPTQIALVTDPISGAVAIAANAASGVEYLPRYWVDGREQPCRTPEGSREKGTPPALATETPDSMRALETRVGQLIQSLDEMRLFHYRFMMTCGAIFCVALCVGVGYTIWKGMTAPFEPPKVNQVVPVPIQIGDKAVILGVGITEWAVPPELNSVLVQTEFIKQELARRAAEEANKTNAAAADKGKSK